ncbi:MAG: nuclear transport factor 2 family protein [Actinomycetota bacterium]|nr:nuclear transport factor 2 family protein [Actinomycetota bacterium]
MDLQEAVRGLQAAFDKGDKETVTAMITDDHVSIMSYAQFYGRASLLEAMPKYKFSEYRIDQLKTTTIGPDVALVTSHGAIRGTYAGKPVPSRVIVGQVWVKQDGRWREATYQETPEGQP